jgi:hypothetical protein
MTAEVAARRAFACAFIAGSAALFDSATAAAAPPATAERPVATATEPPEPPPVATAPVATAPVATAPVATAPVATAPVATAPAATAPVAEAPLPDPATWKQDPPPVLESPSPTPHVPKVEIGVDTGVVSRPLDGDRVHYGLAWAVGGHARVNLARWLGGRVHARFEGSSVTFDDGALGLPSGTHYDSPSFRRVVLGFALEPTITPLPPLDLWLGLGVNWSRTTMGPLHTSGAETVVLPIRSAVFVEFPVSIGVRYHVVPRWLVLNLMGSASFLTNQSGRLESDYETPGASGLLVRVGGFPAFGTSLAALAGVGVLL